MLLLLLLSEVFAGIRRGLKTGGRGRVLAGAAVLLLGLVPAGGAAPSPAGTSPIPKPAAVVSATRAAAAEGDTIAVTASSSLSPKEQEKFLEAVRARYRQPKLNSGRFTQTTIFADSSETQIASGRLWLQGPDKMRWEYLKPEKQLLVSDGVTIWYYTPDLNQVMTGAVKDVREARILVRLLSEVRPETEGMKLVCRRAGKRVLLSLSPLVAGGAPFARMELVFNPATLELLESRMLDLFDNRIVITYRWDAVSAESWPRSRFRFVPPKGCDVMPLGN